MKHLLFLLAFTAVIGCATKKPKVETYHFKTGSKVYGADSAIKVILPKEGGAVTDTAHAGPPLSEYYCPPQWYYDSIMKARGGKHYTIDITEHETAEQMDNSAALQAMLAAADSGQTIIIPPGNFIDKPQIGDQWVIDDTLFRVNNHREVEKYLRIRAHPSSTKTKNTYIDNARDVYIGPR